MENQSSQESQTEPVDISVLLPTRGRTQSLHTSVMSLIHKAERADRVEILLAFDLDDQDSFCYFQENIAQHIDQHGVRYVAYGFTRLGYIRLNEYINSLASMSTGTWLMFWGDDAIMQTQAWDQRIREVKDFRVLRIPTHNLHPYAIFPIVPRDWFDLFGYISAHQLTDTWVSQIAYMLDIMHNIAVEVTHDRFDITGNNNDATYANRPMLEGKPSDPRDFNHVSWRNRRFADAKKIADHIRQHDQTTEWFDRVMRGEQDPWQKMCSAEYDPNCQVRKIN